jgi:hypothetical protein
VLCRYSGVTLAEFRLELTLKGALPLITVPPTNWPLAVYHSLFSFYSGPFVSSAPPFSMTSQSHSTSSTANIVGVHYRVGKKIGEGSFGVIFEGTLPFLIHVPSL